MKYIKKREQFESKRCTFNPHNMEAWSYGWWKFVECRNGKVYFNAASYSMQTRKHQNCVRELFQSMGIKYTLIWIKCGLQDIETEIKNIHFEIRQLVALIANPRSRSKVNRRRKQEIKRLYANIDRLKAYQSLPIEGCTRWYRVREGVDRIIEAQRSKKKPAKQVVNSSPIIDDTPVKREVVRNFTLIHGDKLL